MTRGNTCQNGIRDVMRCDVVRIDSDRWWIEGTLAQLAPGLPLVFARCYTVPGRPNLILRDFHEYSGPVNVCV